MVFEQNAFPPKDLACCFWPRLCKADYSLIILCFIICENADKKGPLELWWWWLWHDWRRIMKIGARKMISITFLHKWEGHVNNCTKRDKLEWKGVDSGKGQNVKNHAKEKWDQQRKNIWNLIKCWCPSWDFDVDD